MFKVGRERRELEQRQASIEAALARVHEGWAALEAARLPHTMTRVDGVVLKKDEVAYVHVSGAYFVEPRREPGRWVGGSHGVSFRVAKGVSYRVGQTRGTYQQGAEVPTPTDEGVFVVTNQRCIFLGSKRTTEWSYAKLLGFSLEGEGVAFFSVSNRQKTTGVLYGTEHEAALDALIAAVIAKFRSDDDHRQLVAELEADYGELYREWQ